MNHEARSNPEAELELNTDDLRELSAFDTTAVAAAEATAAPAGIRKRIGATKRRPILIATTAIGVVASVTFALLGASTPNGPSYARPWKPLPKADPVPVEVPEAVAPAGPPVRIRNAFDRTEVFEFPAGTSKDEAREAVAEILRQRALERHSGSTR
jgi:hypothetical protein